MTPRHVGTYALNLLTYVVAVVLVFPALWLALTAFKTEVAAYSIPPTIIFRPVLDNVASALGDYTHPFVNSLIIVGCSTLAALALGLPAAFSAAIRPTRRVGDLLLWVVSTRFMPAVGAIVPLYLIFKNLGLLDTHLGMVIVYTAMNAPLVVLIMYSFFRDIPGEIIEASLVDGASGLRSFMAVVLPLAMPGIATSALLCSIFSWNEFFFAVNLTNTTATTLPVYMSSFMTSEGFFWSRMSAAATLAVLPIVLLGWMAQKHLVRGLTLGAVR
jgi:sorbitol/mannitol transport system permease protein